MRKIGQYRLIILVAIFFVIFDNVSFFKNTIKVYSLGSENIAFLFSLAVLLVSFIVFLFSLLSSKYTTKPILIFALIASSFANYFMNTYHVVIDSGMLQNALQTDMKESLDLFSLKMVAYIFFLGLLPSYFVYSVKIEYGSFKSELIARAKTALISLGIIVIVLFSFSKFYTSFFREHKPLRYYTNPTYWIYSVGKYVGNTFAGADGELQAIGLDAVVVKEKESKRKIIVLVVGEAARADRFSLNGYKKETNPLLKNENIVNYTNINSCGTSTAVSVPCMFSLSCKDDFNYKKGVLVENVVDVLEHTKEIKVLWRDNNSDSKGVALRVDFESFRTSKNNSMCDDGECRDEGMLVGLDSYIEKHANKDILIILHQMGNHGPAYYKRYPKKFEKFTPVCETNQLENCSVEEISNAYDNAILYTDYFLSKTINFLKKYSSDNETKMIYVSDHGESLGENGLYLHGLPYFMAPTCQTRVAALLWDGGKRRGNIDTEYSHDNLFHTLLGLFNVKTTVYDKTKDIL